MLQSEEGEALQKVAEKEAGFSFVTFFFQLNFLTPYMFT